MFANTLKTAAAVAFVAAGVVAATAAPAQASVTGTGHCSGLQMHSAWLDWGSGLVSVNVHNHTGDNPSVANRTLRFKVEYVPPGNHGHPQRSQTQTLQPSEQRSFEVFTWQQKFEEFDGHRLMQQGAFRFVDCRIVGH